MRITIDMPNSLYRKAKTRAVQNGMEIDELVVKYIENGLCKEHEESSALHRENVPLPVFRHPVRSLIPARSNAELFEILERETSA